MADLRVGSREQFDVRTVAEQLQSVELPATFGAGEPLPADLVSRSLALDPRLRAVLEGQRQLPDGFAELANNDLAGLLAKRQSNDNPLGGPGIDLGPLGLISAPTKRQIKRAETFLKRLGYGVGKVDGQLTPQSIRALTQFQQAVGLNGAPGQLDTRTLSRLEATAKRVADRPRSYLTPGQKSPRIKKLQQRLARLGDFKGTPDGIYGQSTVDAVKTFRARHKDLPNGVKSWSAKAQKALDAELSNMAHDPYRSRVKGSAAQRRVDRETLDAATNGGIGPGSPRSVIRNVQRNLKAAGYNPNREDGVWTDHTKAMINQFQRRSGLPETERLGPNAWNRLSRSTIEARGSFDPRQSIGERSSAVLRTERKLRKAGVDTGKVDGIYTAATERGVDRIRKHFGGSAKADGVTARTDDLIDRRIREKNAFRKPVDARLPPGSEFLVPDAEGAPSSRGGSFHAAKDWFAPGGTKVRSPVAGRIVEVRNSLTNSGQVFGGTVKVQDKKGRVWVFRHVNPSNVHVGQRVSAGKQIARVTDWRDGPDHTHVELWKTLSGGYRLENMIDPMRFLKRFL